MEAAEGIKFFLAVAGLASGTFGVMLLIAVVIDNWLLGPVVEDEKTANNFNEEG